MFSRPSLRRPTSQRTALRFESLERRDVMAGNVIAQVTGGDLVITGDSLSNGVKIMRVDASTYDVVGFVHGGGDTRIIDPLGRPAQRFSGVTNISANLKVGNDDLQLHGWGAASQLTAPGNILITMDAGNDSVFLNYVKAGGNIEVNSGSGVDSLVAVGTTAGNNFFVRESTNPHYAGNNDFVNIYGGSRVGNQLNVKLNQGHDAFKTTGTFAKSLWIEGGAGNDSITIENTTTAGSIRIDPGTGRDATSVQGSTVGDDLIVTEGEGTRATTDYDTIFIGGNQVKDQLQVVGNRGREDVRVDYTVADRLYASLGAGDDKFNIKNSTIRGAWTLDGGAGADTLNRYKNNKTLLSVGFESLTALNF